MALEGRRVTQGINRPENLLTDKQGGTIKTAGLIYERENIRPAGNLMERDGLQKAGGRTGLGREGDHGKAELEGGLKC